MKYRRKFVYDAGSVAALRFCPLAIGLAVLPNALEAMPQGGTEILEGARAWPPTCAAPGVGYRQRLSGRTPGTDLRAIVYHEAPGDRAGLVHCAENCDSVRGTGHGRESQGPGYCFYTYLIPSGRRTNRLKMKDWCLSLSNATGFPSFSSPFPSCSRPNSLYVPSVLSGNVTYDT